jgi:cytidylate kinase
LTPWTAARTVERVTCGVICISHATGAGGEEVGRLVAERLGFRYVDEDIVALAAARGGIRPEEVADEERRKSLVARLLEALEQGSLEAWTLRADARQASEELSSDEIRILILDTIAHVAAHGDAVIVAHAASYVVPHGEASLRVLVTASPGTREARVREAEGVAEADAARAVKQSDAGRRDYLKRFHDVDEELPTHYDLVVNTDVLSLQRAAELVSRAAST